MKTNVIETLKGAGMGFVTILFMVGIIPNADFVSKLLGCAVAMAAVWRIRKKTAEKQPVGCFTVGYISVVVVLILLVNLISAGAKAA